MGLVAMEEGEGVMSAQRMSARVTATLHGALRMLGWNQGGVSFSYFVFVCWYEYLGYCFVLVVCLWFVDVRFSSVM